MYSPCATVERKVGGDVCRVRLLRRANLIVPIDARHLRRTLLEYEEYYNAARTHLGLEKETPESRPAEPPERGAKIVSVPFLGGWRRRYRREAV